MTDWQKMNVWRAGAILSTLGLLEETAPTRELAFQAAALLKAFTHVREGKCETCGCGPYTGPDEPPTFDPDDYPIR
jgi:hypothetical protein